MISVVTFKWKPRKGYRSHFTSHHVNVMRNMVERHYAKPHRFLCVTDDPEGLDPRVEAVPLWNDHAEVPNPTWPDGPSCYRRLKVFSEEFREIAGPRFVCMDLDMVIVDDIGPLLDRSEPFIAMRSHIASIPLCGSMFMMDAGTQKHVWEQFDPAVSPALTTRKGCRGSDQGWLTYLYGTDFPSWGRAEGVYSYMEIAPRRWRRAHGAFPYSNRPISIPQGARIIVFTGKPDPWDAIAQEQAPWIRDHYR